MHRFSVVIREEHIDLLGHVHNATYLELMEEARWDLITSRGWGVKEIQEMQIGPVILEIQIKFLNELRLGQEVTIETQHLEFKHKIGHIKQAMVGADGTLHAEAVFTFGFFDLRARKLVVPSAQLVGVMFSD